MSFSMSTTSTSDWIGSKSFPGASVNATRLSPLSGRAGFRAQTTAINVVSTTSMTPFALRSQRRSNAEILVIPVTVEGAAMPKRDDLPANLKDFANRNGLVISHPRFDADIEKLTSRLSSLLEERRRNDAKRAEREERKRHAATARSARERRQAEAEAARRAEAERRPQKAATAEHAARGKQQAAATAEAELARDERKRRAETARSARERRQAEVEAARRAEAERRAQKAAMAERAARGKQQTAATAEAEPAREERKRRVAAAKAEREGRQAEVEAARRQRERRQLRQAKRLEAAAAVEAELAREPAELRRP
jgi:hypothetical protein